MNSKLDSEKFKFILVSLFYMGHLSSRECALFFIEMTLSLIPQEKGHFIGETWINFFIYLILYMYAVTILQFRIIHLYAKEYQGNKPTIK